jgi:outer membrane immunogenic protein
MKKIFVLAAIAAIVPACALAQGGAPKPGNWTGFYAGVNAGGVIGVSNAKTASVYSSTGYFQTTSVPAVNSTGNQNPNPDGEAGGAQFGYNWQIAPRWVLGAEADFGAFETNGSASGTTVYPCCSPYTFTIAQVVSTHWLTTVRPRLGYTVGTRSLLFVSGGAAETLLHYSSLFTDTDTSANESASTSVLKTGWTAGAGWEYALSNHWSARAEYLYTGFGTVSNAGTVFTIIESEEETVRPAASIHTEAGTTYTFPTTTFTHTANLNSNIFRIAANFRF